MQSVILRTFRPFSFIVWPYFKLLTNVVFIFAVLAYLMSESKTRTNICLSIPYQLVVGALSGKKDGKFWDRINNYPSNATVPSQFSGNQGYLFATYLEILVKWDMQWNGCAALGWGNKVRKGILRLVSVLNFVLVSILNFLSKTDFSYCASFGFGLTCT